MFDMIFLRRQQTDQEREPSKNKKEHLERAIDAQVALYRNWAGENKRKAQRYHLVTALLGAVVTVLLGLQVDGSVGEWLPRAALVLSATITALASIEAFYDPRGQTVRSMGTYLQLLRLRAEYKHAILPPLAGKGEEELVEEKWKELQTILSQEHSQRMEALQHQNQAQPEKAA